MKLVGETGDAQGTTIDLRDFGTHQFRERKAGVPYTFDLMDGEQKVHRKGKKRRQGTLSGNSALNYTGPESSWTDPQSSLTSLRDFAGEFAELQWNDGTAIGRYYVNDIEVDYTEMRERGGEDEGFMEFRWTVNLTEMPSASSGGGGGGGVSP